MKSKSALLLSALALAWLAITPGVRAQALPKVDTLYTFRPPSGSNPTGNIVRDADGNFYGTTEVGGGQRDGTAYKITPDGKLTDLVSFSGGNGIEPVAGLIRGSDGAFYGTTPTFPGTAFRVTADGTLTTLYEFAQNSQPGHDPIGGVIEGADGNFYGTTSGGGAGNSGTIYRLTPAGSATVLHVFSALDSAGHNSDGASSQASLLEDENGDFYGVSASGGANGTGTVFRFSPTRGFTTLHSFNAINGNNTNDGGVHPASALVRGVDGTFYGVTVNGGSNGTGTIFRITPDGTLTTLYGFSALDANHLNDDGANPGASLLLGSDGSFYGTASVGGANGTGTVFKLTPAGKFTTLYSFDALDTQGRAHEAGSPAGPLIQDDVGKFYGTTQYGVKYGYGLLFRLVTAEPTIYSPLSAYATVGQAFSYKINATSVPTRYQALNLPDGLTIDNATGFITGTPTGAGPFTVTIQAGNADGVDSAPLTLNVRSTMAPVITSADTASGVAGTPFSYQITADNFPTSYGVLGLPKGLSVDARTGLISGSPAGAGTFHLTLKVSDNAGADTAPLTLTVTLAAPVITSARTAVGTVGRPFSYQITSTGAARHYGVLGLPPGLSVNATTGLISGTPQASGTDTLTLKASNAAGADTQSLSLSVADVVPVITSATTASGTVGAAFSYQITAANAPQKYHVLRLPPGLHVDAVTGLISGTPTVAGTVKMTLEAVNSAGTGEGTLTLTVTSN